MVRIAGININDNKKVTIGLSYIYGIGRSLAKHICIVNKIDYNKKLSELSNEETDRIRNYIDKNYKVEGDIKIIINQNIKRLKEIGSYRGLRHMKRLPCRGQRTKTNARTKRGKRVCVGSGKKASAEKT